MQIEVIMKFEDMCMGSGKEYSPLFEQVYIKITLFPSIIQKSAAGGAFFFIFFSGVHGSHGCCNA